MMAGVKMTAKGNASYYSNLSKKFKGEITRYLDDAVTNTEADAVQAAPSDAGFLRNSSFAERKGLDGTVGFKVHYAPYVEFGTGGLVDVPNGLEEYALQFKGDGIRQVNLTPRPFLYPAWKKNGLEFLDRLEKLFISK